MLHDRRIVRTKIEELFEVVTHAGIKEKHATRNIKESILHQNAKTRNKEKGCKLKFSIFK